MNSPSPDSASDDRLEEILHEYLQAVDAGRPPDREEWLRRHPDCAAELADFFANEDQMARLAHGMGEEDGAPSTDFNAQTVGYGDPREPAPGTRIRYFGDYELMEEIARGGMGVVYRARQVSLNRVVALKMILSGHLASPREVRRFQAEAEAAANLDHPHIVPIHEVGQHEGQQYFSMKFVEGGSLLGSLERFRTDPPATARLFQKVARAVHYAHQRGILHRDLKPANILLDRNKEPIVADFGLAKRLEPTSDLTHSGALVGTPGYMAPEQARAEKGLSTAVDVYGLGAILYEVLTGRPPFQGSTPMETVRHVLEDEPAHPRSLNAKVEPELATICLKCLEKAPADRYQSTEALSDDLGRWLNGEPIAARPCGRLQRIRKYIRRKPAIACLFAVSTLALIAFIATLSISNVVIARKEAQISAAFQAERRTSYIQRVGRAYSDWQSGDLGSAARLLEDCPADLRGWEWRYLDHLCHAEKRLYAGHAKPARGFVWPVTTLAFDPNGRRVASLDRGGLVRIWDPETGRDLESFQVDGDNIDVAAFSPDLTRLAYIPFLPTEKRPVPIDLYDLRRTIQVWDVTTGRRLIEFRAASSRNWQMQISCVVFSPDGQRIASSRRINEQSVVLEEVKVWEVATGRDLHTIGSGAGGRSAECIAFSPDGTRIATGDEGWGNRQPAVRTWDVRTGNLLRTLPVDRGVRAVAYSPEGMQIAASCGSTLRVWDTASGREVRTLPGAGPYIAFSPDSSWIASNGPEPVAVIWEIASGKEHLKLRGSYGRLAFSPDGQRLATASQGSLVKLWDTGSQPEARLLCADTRYSRALRTAWSPDSQQLIVAGFGWDFTSPKPLGGTRWVWGAASFQSETGREVFRLPRNDTESPFSVCVDSAFSPRGDRFAILAIVGKGKDNVDEYFVRIYDSNSHELLSSFRRVPPAGGLSLDDLSIAYAKDGRLVLEFVDDRRFLYVEVCDATTGKTAFVVEGIQNHPAVSPDGRLMATVHDLGQVRLWDTSTGRRLAEIGSDGKGGRLGIAINAEGRRVAVTRAEGLVVYALDSGKVRELFRSAVGCEVAAFTPDGRSLATGSSAGIITIWDSETGQEAFTLHGHGGAIRGLSFSPNGCFLASVGGDGSVKLWEAAPPR